MDKDAMYLMLEGKNVEKLWEAILPGLDDTMLDQIQVKRKIEEPHGLAGEPVTIALCIASVSVAAIVAVTRIIEKVIESRQQKDHIRIIADVVEKSPEAARILEGLAKKYADVSIAQGSPGLSAKFDFEQ